MGNRPLGSVFMKNNFQEWITEFKHMAENHIFYGRKW
jgi:hypothetical protein